MISKFIIVALFGVVIAQDYQDYGNAPRAASPRIRQGGEPVEQNRQAPVAILKQINKHNEDGSYTYGYEGADGSFKIETKLATGEVKGKYGYVDETGKVRVVEYGANKYGFQPSGEGITVAPPTLVDETTPDGPQYEDEPQRPQKPFIARVPRPQQQQQLQPRPQPRPVPVRPQYNVDYDEESEPEQPRHQQYSPGPAPPRLQIPGAQPVDVVYSQNQQPARPDGEYTQRQSFGAGPSNVRISRPVYAAPQPAAPASRAQQFVPIRPVTEVIPQYQQPSRPAPQPIQYRSQPAPQGRSTSVLDQLAKDYALPQGGSQPLHDISFGYY